jgi:uncharacterized protein YjiS (DUF1127 family)
MTMHRDIRSFRPTAPTIRRRLAVFLNHWVTAIIAHREREAARFLLGHLSDRELKDIGIYRSHIDDGLAEIARRRARLQRSERPRWTRTLRVKPAAADASVATGRIYGSADESKQP